MEVGPVPFGQRPHRSQHAGDGAVPQREDRARKSTTTRWKVGRVNATENAETSGSAALGTDNISDSFPIRRVSISECTGESDFL